MPDKKATPDKLTLVRRVLDEHSAIKATLGLEAITASEVGDLFRLKDMEAGWAQVSFAELAEKRKKVDETFTFLAERLPDHFAREEEVFRQILSDILVRSLVGQHHEIMNCLGEARRAMDRFWEGKLSSGERIVEKPKVQRLLSRLVTKLVEHGNVEELILQLAGKSLQTATKAVRSSAAGEE